MESAVIIKRELFDSEISQNSKTEFFSATDLMRAGNKWRVINGMQYIDWNDWYNTKSTQEFVKILENKYGVVKITGRGRGKHTWIHPFLFLELALSLNPLLKIQVYEWLYDNLIKYRNESGDSYKKMAGALWISCTNKTLYKDEIINFANRIKIACKVTDWEKADEKQLKLRDQIHENISLLSDIIKDRENLFNVSVKKAQECIK